MGTILVFVEHQTEPGKTGIRAASLPAIAAARQLAEKSGSDGTVTGVLIGQGLGSAAQDLSRYVAKVVTYDHADLVHPLAETFAPVLVSAVQASGAQALLATATSTAKDVLPRVAALLGAGMVSDIVKVDGPKTFRRPAYAGNALEDVEVTSALVVASVRQTGFEPAAPSAAAGTIEQGAVGNVDAKGALFVALRATQSARPDLSEAKIVVSGGRGMRAGENFKGLEELTDLLGGALGASRAACDAGMVPNDLQVGQTGKVVAPQLYVAVAISGAIQHLAGMKGSKVIVAINKDAEAPIFQVADYGLVTTWETAVPALIAEVKKLKSAG
jgi:electron transfer flavoprotein alpha subunit